MIYTGVLGSFRLVGDEGALSVSGSETKTWSLVIQFETHTFNGPLLIRN